MVVVAFRRVDAQQLVRAEESGVAFLPEPVALAPDVQDMAVMQQPVQDGRGDHRVAQEFAPLAEALVGREDDAAPLVPGRHQGEKAVADSRS